MKNPTIESGFLCPFTSPAIEQGFFIFGSATPIAPSWEVLLESIYCASPETRMTNMPDKPDTWLLVLAWLGQHAPTIYAGALSFVVGALRIIYGGGTQRQALLEASLCTLITIGLIPLLEYFGLPQNFATAAGVFIGFLGVKKIADLADRFADFKFPKSDSAP